MKVWLNQDNSSQTLWVHKTTNHELITKHNIINFKFLMLQNFHENFSHAWSFCFVSAQNSESFCFALAYREHLMHNKQLPRREERSLERIFLLVEIGGHMSHEKNNATSGTDIIMCMMNCYANTWRERNCLLDMTWNFYPLLAFLSTPKLKNFLSF